MEELSSDAAALGFGIFNRWGCLKPEFLNHPIKKGTGVWGTELNEGRFVLIETLSIQENYQRKSYGKKLFEQVWAKAQKFAMQDNKVFGTGQKASVGCSFAIVWPTVLNTTDVTTEAQKLSPAERLLFYGRKQLALEEFWKAMGFRRIGSSIFFCLAKDPKHISHQLTPQEDYARPVALKASPRVEGQDYPLLDPADKADIFEQKQHSDSETKDKLQARLHKYAATDTTWTSTDRHQNNILHVLAREGKAESLTWVLARPFAHELRSARNLEGETPLEALESQLESDRTWKQFGAMQVVTSDLFSGFATNQVECLKLLSGVEDLSPNTMCRLTFGCTCGQCLGGFLSPRVAFALECQAETNYDMLRVQLNDGGADWCDYWDHMLEHLSQRVRANLRTSISMRLGFTKTLSHIAKTLQARMLPTTENVLPFQRGENECAPCTKNFLQRGGTVDAVLQACFDCAKDQDQYSGDGTHDETFNEDIAALPACRNDGEYVFASRMCRKLQGLPWENASRP